MIPRLDFSDGDIRLDVKATGGRPCIHAFSCERCDPQPATRGQTLEVVQSLDESLDEVARKALQQWRFEPGKKDGQAVLVQIDVKMAFTMVAKRKRWWWPLA